MAKALYVDLRERVIAAMRSGQSCRAAVARFGVAPPTAKTWAGRAARMGSVGPGKKVAHRRSILRPHRDWSLGEVRACRKIALAFPGNVWRGSMWRSATTRSGGSFAPAASASMKDAGRRRAGAYRREAPWVIEGPVSGTIFRS